MFFFFKSSQSSMLSQSKDQYKSWTEWSSSQVCTHVFEGKEKGLMDWGSTLEQRLSKVNEKKRLFCQARAFGWIKCFPGEEKCFSHKLLVRHVPLKLTKWWKWAGANVEKVIFFLIWKLRCSVRLKVFFNFYIMSR